MDERVFLFVFQKDFISLWHVVKIGTGIHIDLIVVDVFVEGFPDVGVVHCLVRGMPIVIDAMSAIGDHIVF